MLGWNSLLSLVVQIWYFCIMDFVAEGRYTSWERKRKEWNFSLDVSPRYNVWGGNKERKRPLRNRGFNFLWSRVREVRAQRMFFFFLLIYKSHFVSHTNTRISLLFYLFLFLFCIVFSSPFSFIFRCWKVLWGSGKVFVTETARFDGLRFGSRSRQSDFYRSTLVYRLLL